MNEIGFATPLRGFLHPATAPDAPTVIVAHGFKGFMGWGMFPWIADRLAEAGCAAVRFDFSHNGADENGDFTRLDLFRENTLTKEQADLAALVDAIGAGREPFGGRCRPDRLGLVGHSRGGAAVVLRAAQEPRVAAVATLAGVSRTDRFDETSRTVAEKLGFVNVFNARTNQKMPVGREYFRDAVTHDLPGSAHSLAQPLLVVHGTKDESVPVAEGRELEAAAGKRATLLEIEGAGHTFGAVHPFQGPTPHLEEAVAAVSRFFLDHLA